MKALKILERAVQEGYLLHGSGCRLDLVEPQWAINRRKSVVHATNIVRIAVLFAITHPIDPKKKRVRGCDGVTGGVLRVFGENITFKAGYVHVLPSATFEPTEDGEFVSQTAVSPVKIFRFSPQEIVRRLNLQVDFSW